MELTEDDIDFLIGDLHLYTETESFNIFGLIQWSDESIVTTLLLFFFYLLIATIIKIGYRQSHFLTSTIPESCVLIMVGIAFGAIMKICDFKDIPKFTPNLFFFVLMPPIILHSAFMLHDESFFDNIITILMFAIVGTLMNVFLIGGSLYFISLLNISNFPGISFIELLIFSNAISAVDPVTVITIFEELKVNKPLYYLVFGESLLNDAVVITVHNLLSKFVSDPFILSKDIIEGYISFFSTSIGGFIVGVLFGFGTSFITKYTRHALVIEPMVVIGMAYSSFLTADLIGWSGLISLIGCGLIQYEFAFENVSTKTRTVVKYLISSLSSVSEMLIFFFLGQMLMNEEHHWNTLFIVFTLLFCLIFRSISVGSLAYISNYYFHRTRPIKLEEQILLAYGGLRGAVAFAMIALLEGNEDIENYKLLKTTTYVLIFFTVFILGGTTKPVVNFLSIQTESNDKKLCFYLNDKVIDFLINGIEDLVANPSPMNYIKHKSQDLIKYLKIYLCNKREDRIVREIPKLLKLSKIDEPVVGEKTNLTTTSETDSLQTEDCPKRLAEMAQRIEINKEIFKNIVMGSHKANKNPFFVEELKRKRVIPKEISSRVIAANQRFNSSKEVLSKKLNPKKLAVDSLTKKSND